MRGKMVLVLVLTCLLALGLAGTAFAAMFPVPPGTVMPSGVVVDKVYPPPALAERNPDVTVLERSYVNVWFFCAADPETVRVFDFGNVAALLPVAVDVRTGKAYAVLPEKPEAILALGWWCGYDAPVEYLASDGQYVQGGNLLVPLADVAQGKRVYVRISRAWVDDHPSLFGRPSKFSVLR